MTLNEFIAMGGYGLYVWSSYSICVVVLLINMIQPIMRERKTIAELKKRFQSQQDNSAGN